MQRRDRGRCHATWPSPGATKNEISAEDARTLLSNEVLQDIHRKCAEHGKESDGSVNYVRGANIAGFMRVAGAMLAYGIDWQPITPTMEHWLAG